ncbi:MAG: OprO/OprP family phosphate-selective porin [Xanthomonadaceae bacterium]|nr:OprO/OprP family phosphate-selective porin [Xanthomonadaceae bacterium]
MSILKANGFICGLLAFALLALPPVVGPAHAANSAMLELIEILYNKGSIDEQEYQLLLKAAREDAGAAVAETDQEKIADEVSRQVEEATADMPKITTKDKLEFASKDGQSKWSIFGRVQTDAAFYDSDTDNNGNSIPLADFGQEVRRARLGVSGTIFGNWGLKVQYDFPSTSVKDAFLSYTMEGGTQFKLGHFKEPFSISELTSSKYQTFMERPTTVTAFVPARNTGIGVFHTYGKLATLSAGIFGEGLDSGGNGDTASYAVTGRATIAPINAGRRVVHFGSAITHRQPNDTDTGRFRDRFETHVTDIRLVDTGTIGGIDSITKANFEVATVYNRYSQNLRFQINYNAVTDHDGGNFPGAEPSVLQARGQIYW